ncbi:MAG: gamma-glutamyl-gamma-aminobutyrate hydrolase family protein [Candidatus Binatia bacterium]
MNRGAPVRLMDRAGPTLVGVSSYARAGEVPSFSIPTGYIDAVRAAGAVPIVLPPGEREPARLLAALNALIVSGGGDINPKAYGGAAHETVYAVCEERDEFEFALTRAALADTRVPLLCICRGLQVLNVVCGGSLHVHLPEHYGEQVAHRTAPRNTSMHAVRIDPDSRLAQILGTSEAQVRSWHHQAIDRLGDDLRPVAWAEDGVVEAVEHVRHPWCIGVQWHPEMQLDDPAQQGLFRALLGQS